MNSDWRSNRWTRVVIVSYCGALLSVDSAVSYAAPPANSLPQAAANWLQSGAASNSTAGNTMTVNQASQKAILNWNSFNIGKDSRVQFVQPSANAIALNRIGGGSASEIFGQLGANGSVYLINNNGILFGAGSQVNVHGLVASTLNIDDNTFLNSSISRAVDSGSAAFAGGTVPDAAVRVESGAAITTDSGGQVLMFAPTVENAGSISTPDGQAILAAAKDKVYLATSDQDESLRGLLVEVSTGGDVRNVGSIVAERGNITLLGLAVNQDGYLRATTSVDVNGSIRLLARDQATVVSNESSNVNGDTLLLDKAPVANSKIAVAEHTGSVTFGTGSVTEVTADTNGKTAADAQTQNTSRIVAEGKTIELQDDSRITAKGGQVDLVATASPRKPYDISAPNDSRIFLGNNAIIDVSGENVVLPMSRRVVEVELRGNELQDAPLQRDGILRGATVKVDIEKGSPLISEAAWSAIKAGIKKDVKERLTAGGSVNLRSQGDVVMNSGATVDISGGSVNYAGGAVTTTKLMSDGRIFDIGNADPNRHYDAILGEYTDVNSKWGKTVYGLSSIFNVGSYRDAFTEGADGGALNIDSQALYGLDLAQLKAAATSGVYQRSASAVPAGGSIDIALGQDNPNAAVQDVDIDGGAHSSNLGFGEALTVADGKVQNLYIDADQLSRSGLGSFTLKANGAVALESGASVQLAPRGSGISTVGEDNTAPGAFFSLTGTALRIDGDVRAPGGNILLSTTHPQNTDVNGNYAITIGSGSVLDVSGLWINDPFDKTAAATTPLLIDGGWINVIASGDLNVAADASLRADGGAYLNSGGSITGGDGGRIKLATRALNLDDAGSQLVLEGDFSAYGFDTGGSLSLEANAIQIGGSTAADNTLHLDTDFFQRGGFSSYSLSANLYGIEVTQDSSITLRQHNRVIADYSAAARHATGDDVRLFSSVTTLPDWLRQAVDLSLVVGKTAATQLQSGDLLIDSGVRISGEPGAHITLSSDRSLFVDGVIDAPGGTIDLSVAPVSSLDPGYSADQSIWLGQHAQLLARAAQVLKPNSIGGFAGNLWDAGDITLRANRGAIVAEPGSLLDVSGASFWQSYIGGSGESSGFITRNINAAAGSISFTAAESLAVYGDLRGFAAGSDGLGGSLTLRMDANRRAESASGSDLFSGQYAERELRVVQDMPDWDGTLSFGAALPGSWKGIGWAATDRISAGGFSRLTLGAVNKVRASTFFAAPGRISFEDDIDLSLADSVVLDSVNIALNDHTVNLSAGSVAVGRTDGSPFAQQTETARTGNGTLTLAGGFIELLGSIGVSDAQDITLNSGGDVRVRSVYQSEADTELQQGTFTAAGNLTLKAAQIYPTTLTDYLFQLTGADSVFTTAATGARTPILSAGGALRVQASTIEHGGVLVAPLGTIELTADKSIHLAAGSVLDVSAGSQLIPFGRLQGDDISWIYPLNANYPHIIDSVPEKQVLLDAPDIDMAAGSSIDLSGGGDVTAFELVPGPGGSKDFLDAANADGAFAVIPALNSPISPYDALEMQGSARQTGDIVYLDGAAGLPAGYYAVLPAHYALLPGAYLITPTGNTVAQGQSSTRIDGAAVVSGRFGRAYSGQYDSQWQSFVIEQGSAARTRSEYNEAKGDDYFAGDGSALAQDAGRISLAAQQRLNLDGSINAAAQNGRGAQMDIVADLLEVVADGEGSSGSGAVQVDAGALSRLGIDSLLLGGVRSRDGSATRIDVRAGSVTVRDGATLTAPDVILAANNQVTVESGAQIVGTGTSSQDDSVFNVAGDGALLRVSSAGQADVVRTGSVSGSTGALTIAGGARLQADASMLLDATGAMTFDGELALPDGSLNISANRISIGDAVGAVDGVVLSSTQLAGLGAKELRLSSRSSIDFYGDVAFANDRAELNAGTLLAMAPGAVHIAAADTLQLSNTADVGATGGGGGGQLVLAAKTVELGSERDAGTRMDLNGFDSIQLGEAGLTAQVIGRGDFQLHTGGDLNVVSDRIGADAGAVTELSADGAVTLASAGAPAASAVTASAGAAPPMGAELTITGARVSTATAIELPSGTVTLAATGSAADDNVTLLDGASIDVGGRTVAFPNSSVSAAGGEVHLHSASGDVVAAGGASVSLGSAEGGDAGLLDIVAAGRTQWQGSIDATAGSGFDGGSLSLDVGSLGDLGAWLARAADSGIDHSIKVRARSGDLLLDQNARAAQVSISADDGNLTVAATVDAAGENGGSIALNAGGDLLLTGTALLQANATGSDGRGGKVQLGVREGTLRFDAGSRIDVAGNGGRDGSVDLRAPRSAGNDAVAVSNGGVAVSGAESVDLEAFKTYDATTVTTALMAQAQSDAVAFMTNETAIKTALGESAWHLRPGVEIDSSGNLTVSSQLNFSGQRFGADGEAGVLTLRAAGNLLVQQSLLDGFVDDDSGLWILAGSVWPKLLEGPSWDYRLVAGADFGAADVTATISETGDLVVSGGNDIITGAGAIGLYAGGNVDVQNAGSVIASLGSTRWLEYDDPLAGTPVGDALGLSATGVMPDTGTLNAFQLFLTGQRYPFYPEHGGDVTIAAGKDVSFAKTTSFFTDWITRLAGEYSSIDLGQTVTTFTQTTWGILLDGLQSAKQGIAVLGGGNLDVSAGGDVVNLNAVLPVTGKQVGTGGNNEVAILGGGSASVVAGGDILSPRLMVDDGRMDLHAGGDIGATAGSLDAVLALADTQAVLSARGDIAVASVMNSTFTPQSSGQVNSTLLPENYFFTYSDTASLRIDSLAGDVVLKNDAEGVSAAFNSHFAAPLAFKKGFTNNLVFALYPGQVQVDALQGSIDITGGVTANRMALFPTGDSQLVLNAGEDILGANTHIFLPDVDTGSLPDMTAIATQADVSGRLFGIATTGVLHATQPVHGDDHTPAVINALTGDIRNTADNIADLFVFEIAKPVQVSAGRDITNISLNIQHNSDADNSEVVAGRDIRSPLEVDSSSGRLASSQHIFQVAGPGRLDVIAGRNIDLGASEGILSIGNRENGALPDSGADITLMAGINGATAFSDPALYQAFVDQYLSATGTLNGSFIDWFAAGSFQGDAAQLVSTFTGSNYASRVDAMTAFAQLPALTRQAIALAAYRQAHATDRDHVADLVNFVSFERFGGDLAAAANAVLQPQQPYQSNAEAAAALAQLPAAQQQQVALRALNAAPLLARRGLLLSVLYDEVRAGGVEDANGLVKNAATDGFARSRAAIAAMFPGDQWDGDLSLVLSAVRTLGDGDINVLVPGGDVNVGLAANVAGITKESGSLGILAQRYGAVNAIASGSFNVNQSRIFSLDGGDITLWSSEGDIDAGKGAKSALTIPPATIKEDPVTGNLTLEFPAAVAGSGIQTAGNNRKRAVDRGALAVAGGSADTYRSRQRYFSSLTPGDVYLFAPKGVVNAGDAGIQVGGNLLVAAQQVLGANNISVGGVSIGVPTTTAISAGTLSLGDVASSATDSATSAMNEAMQKAAQELSEGGTAFVTVDIIGVGK